MTVYIGNRIAVQSSTSGTGTFNFSSALTGYQKFTDAVISAGTQACYTAVDSLSSPTQWEIGIGTVGTSTLTRDTIEESSNSDAKVNFSSNPYIFCAPSRKHLLIFDDASNLADVRTAIGIGTGSTVNIGALQVAGTTRIAADGSGAFAESTFTKNGGSTVIAVYNQSADNLGTPVQIYKKGGSAGSSSPTESGAEIGYFGINGWNGSAYKRTVTLLSRAVETFSGSVNGAKLEFWVVPAGSSSASVRLSVGDDTDVSNGNLKVAGTTRIASDGTGSFSGLSVSSAFPYIDFNDSNSTSGKQKTTIVHDSDALRVMSYNGSTYLRTTMLCHHDGYVDVVTGPLQVASQEIATTAGHLKLRSYTVGTLPSASTAQQLIYVSNGASNKRLAVSDGTNWRWPDGAIVS